MARTRFVLRYRGDGPTPDADVAKLQELADVVIVDSSARMLVVEGKVQPLRDVVEALPDWIMGPDVAYPVPSTRKKVRRPPD